jgi:hypothetical protein
LCIDDEKKSDNNANELSSENPNTDPKKNTVDENDFDTPSKSIIK